MSRQAAAAPSAAGNAANGSAAAASDSEDEITHVVTESLDERIQASTYYTVVTEASKVA